MKMGMGTPMEALMASRLIQKFSLGLVGCCTLTLMMAETTASAAVLVVAEARGIALKPGAALDSAKPLTLKQGQHVTLISEAGWTLWPAPEAAGRRPTVRLIYFGSPCPIRMP